MLCFSCGEKIKKSTGDYHYTESGLENIILKNLTIFKCSCGEKSPVIPDMGRLHQVIAMEVVKVQTPLEGTEIRFLRKEMGFNTKEFAKLLGVYNVTTSRWETGQETIGNANDRLIRLLFIRHLEWECEEFINANMKKVFEQITKKPRKVSIINIPMHRISKLQPCSIQ